MQVWIDEFHIHTCIPDGHLHRVTYAICRIDKIDSPDDEHMVARNMKRIEINIYGKQLCVKLVIYKNYTERHCQLQSENCAQICDFQSVIFRGVRKITLRDH